MYSVFKLLKRMHVPTYNSSTDILVRVPRTTQAPWNIILAGGGVDYIDYDTRDITFDEDIPKVRHIMLR